MESAVVVVESHLTGKGRLVYPAYPCRQQLKTDTTSARWGRRALVADKRACYQVQGAPRSLGFLNATMRGLLFAWVHITGRVSDGQRGVWRLGNFQSQGHLVFAVSRIYTSGRKQQEHLPRPPMVVFPGRWDTFARLLHIGCALNHTDDVVSLGEEGYPVVEGPLLLVVQILPFGLHILGLD